MDNKADSVVCRHYALVVLPPLREVASVNADSLTGLGGITEILFDIFNAHGLVLIIWSLKHHFVAKRKFKSR